MKKIVSTAVATVAMVAVMPAVASAWTFNLKANGACQDDGSYQVTWTIKNPENEPFTVRMTSDKNVFKAGTEVPAKDSLSVTQTFDGTTTGKRTLTIKGNWPSDTKKREMTATNNQYVECEQPEEGGKGGEETPVEETPVVETPVVTPVVAPAVVPVGAVSAGNGGASTAVNAAAIAALVASIAAVAVGIVRRARNNG